MMVRERSPNRWELRVKHRLLPKPFYATFPSEAEANDYGERLEAMLAQGIVLNEFLPQPGADNPLLARVIHDYLKGGAIPPARAGILALLRDELANVRLASITYRWAEAWVIRMKRDQHLAPGTLRKRVSALAIALDAHQRRAGATWANPLRQLPRGYSSYSPDDAAALQERGLAPKSDITRDRRLLPAEELRIRAALAGEKRPDRERALELPHGAALAMLFDLILDTGLRLREAYTLRVDQIDLDGATINVAGTKGKQGEMLPRQVPIKPALRAQLAAYLVGRVGLVFPWWDGQASELRRTTARLSRAFGRVFEYAAVADCTEHDLRHEATCRWFELRSQAGVPMFSDIEICRVMGWTDPRMALRYASLRGSDLAARFTA